MPIAQRRAALAAAAALALAQASAPAAAESGDPRHVPSVRPTPGALAPVAGDPLHELFEGEFPPEDEMDRADPFEPANRKLFALNEIMNAYFFDPMVEGYRFVVPDPGRRALRRFFDNLNAPAFFVNDLLQLRFKDAAETLGCFVLNSAFGAGGLFDVGREASWELRRADFGQTLARAGIGSGPYLVLPILGPSTLRDGFGDLVDQLFNPLTYVLGPGERIFLGGSSGFTTLDQKREQLTALRESSVDLYAALRSAYLQNRRAQIWSN